MRQSFDTQAPKKATNVSINSDLLARAKALGINLSATLEGALAGEISARQRAQWKAENQQAIAAYNGLVESGGTFGDGLREF